MAFPTLDIHLIGNISNSDMCILDADVCVYIHICVDMYVCIFYLFIVDGHLVCFHITTIVTNINTKYKTADMSSRY